MSGTARKSRCASGHLFRLRSCPDCMRLMRFRDEERNELRQMLAETLTPDGIDYWLHGVERTKTFEEARAMADALRSGAFL